MSNPTDPLVGRTVGQYEVVAKLGGGGMGIVYAARDLKLGRRVALKFLPPQWCHDESAKQRFIREAQAASSTDHRNICTIHDIETADDGQLFIVMAHYEGQTLKQRLESGALPVDEAVDIAAQIAEGLNKAHAQGVVHRDIKPGNLILTEDGVKILDFGLAKLADQRFKLTQEGSTLGTIAYMSPEQTRGEEADHRSDIWATGVVLYEMLAGEAPFKGGYREAIAHAIQNDPPLPLRGFGETGPRPAGVPSGPPGEISEALEQLVFRALHKDPAIRFQTARDLARALRQLQGRTIPLDLRTEPLPPIDHGTRPPLVPRKRWWQTTAAMTALPVIVATTASALWLFSPVDQVSLAVAPVVNQTGDPQLDAYRLALTQELIAALAESPGVRVVPYDRTLQIVRRFQTNGDVSSREAVQTLTASTGASLIVLPTLSRENGVWKARADFQRADTATVDDTVETEAAVSSLMKDTAYSLIASLAAAVEDRIRATGPRRGAYAHQVRTLAGLAPPRGNPRFQSLDAAKAFSDGLDAYDQQELTSALSAFEASASADPRSPLPQGWRSRVALLLGQTEEAAAAADAASQLLSEDTVPRERLFVEAVAAEARRNYELAEERYRALVDAFPDEAFAVSELAAYQDRRASTQDAFAEAVGTYRRAVELDSRLVRPHLELCRLYNRLNDPPNAKKEGTLALSAYRLLGAKAGEAQALWCLPAALRIGNADDRKTAREHADAALALVRPLGFVNNMARAQYYVGLAAFGQRNPTEAVKQWEAALDTATNARNAVLEPLLLMNLGATHDQLGNPSNAVEYYRRSQTFFEARGDETRAAQVEANRGALLITYGPNPAEGFNALQNALVVAQKVGDRTFEITCRRAIAEHFRITGRFAEAQAQLNQALAIAKERDLTRLVPTLMVDQAISRIDVADYATATSLLDSATGEAVRTLIVRGVARVRTGDFDTAFSELSKAEAQLKQQADLRTTRRLFSQARGEAAYESGRLDEARRYFETASTQWVDETPDEASVIARAYLGLIDALEGRLDRSRSAIRAALDHAQKMGRYTVEARSRVFLARIDVAQRRFNEALALLKDIPPDGDRALGPELQAQVHYWRGQALAGRGDRAAADAQNASARQLLEQLRTSLPEAARAAFTARRTIAPILDAAVRETAQVR